MRKGLVALLGFAVAATGAMGQTDARPGIAVLPFDNGGSYGRDAEDFDAMQVGLAQMLITELSANPKARLVDRRVIRQIIEEQDLGASGRVDAETAARIGQLVGARYVVTGGFIDFYGDLRIDARIVDVETSEILKAEQVRDKRTNLFTLVSTMAGKVMQDVNLPPLPTSVQRERQSREPPTEDAVNYYLRGLLAADRGDTAQARELFSRAIEVFPAYTEAAQELQQLGDA
jgi:TolB-like protein